MSNGCTPSDKHDTFVVAAVIKKTKETSETLRTCNGRPADINKYVHHLCTVCTYLTSYYYNGDGLQHTAILHIQQLDKSGFIHTVYTGSVISRPCSLVSRPSPYPPHYCCCAIAEGRGRLMRLLAVSHI